MISVRLPVLILIVVDNGLVHHVTKITKEIELVVLILIVVDNGLVHIRHTAMSARQIGLNPYCSGQWSRTLMVSATYSRWAVLILIVVDNGLVPTFDAKGEFVALS